MIQTLKGRLGAASIGLAVTAALAAPAALAQDYPAENVQYIVQSGVGGGSDILARTLAKVLEEEKLLPVKMLVENRPGGAGAIAYSYISGQEGNPYLLGGVGVSFFTTPILGNSPVDYRSFTPLAAIARSPYILASKAGSDITSLDFIKEHGGLRAGTAAAVSDPTLLSARVAEALGTEIRVVPFDGEGEVLAALLGGHIDLIFGNPNEIIEQIDAGALQPIAVSSAERMESLPDVPTFTEQGIDIVHTQLRGVIMPPGQTPEIVAFWEDTLRKVAESDAWREHYVDRFSEVPAYLDSKGFAAEMETTNAMYDKMMHDLGMVN
ncbi:tripartite tricarboxylate transporter substrate binding protein [Frigidibacter sp. MR17.24]|uniref:tripartite tricarboxylate transporter substrate binding protein n=1 Tax=Frigidibacter sp. MR17.24 TaxID=3127345 RepID=UPI003012A906